MSELVARTSRHQQGYEGGCRRVFLPLSFCLCIPFKYRKCDKDSDCTSEKVLEVLMINSSSTSGSGLVFPKGGWENDETVEEAVVREGVEEAGVRGELMDFLGYYEFKKNTLQDEFCPEGVCKAAVFALLVMGTCVLARTEHSPKKLVNHF
ncbi:Nudix hydrolase 16 mitochondrial-like [Quillaja saponaria]|uniref:Nudix hydrolase 16 mitochondrial-like n=1 Tax=Quillaja saponaria TaxID=32244 RepID=A0AAD7VI35_QUISA|nr:Nudix hydrolase 16 mitochondrial-like [Quillaja saponaria]